MNAQHQRRALSAIAAVLAILLAGCVNAAAAQPAGPTTAAPTTTPPTTAASSRSVAPPPAGLGGANQPGCAARAMAQGTFNPACSEYQGYLDPGTTGGRAPTSGEIQRENLCRSGEIPKTEC